MAFQDKSDLFEFMLTRIKETATDHLYREPEAFGRWFAELFFMSPRDIFTSDGSRDGKIDLFFTTHNGRSVSHHILNSKFTKEYDKIAPPAFYAEIKYFWQVFANRTARAAYLEEAVKAELRPRYKLLFDKYDNGTASLMFITNHRINPAHSRQVKNIPVQVFHLDDLIQCLVDDIDGAMPRTPPISLNGVHAVLSPDKSDTEVATSIVFARLLDFIRYMESDPFDLLFNRNVRVAISTAVSGVNRAIRETFRSHPKEFAFSNNGITMLCEKQHYDPGQKVLTLENPRVVNGSQTLHSIRDVPNPSSNARVMVRVIEVEPPRGDDVEQKIVRRKEVIGKIAVRSNRQNPIRSWDLASNDDFQLTLFRFFRSKGYFYERRNGEWPQRSRELKSVKIRLGDNIKWLTQLIASFYWDKSKLGPVIAKSVSELFEGATYDAIRETTPELAYQIHLLGDNFWKQHRALASAYSYVRQLKLYGFLAAFAIASRVLQECGAKFGNASLTETLEVQRQSRDTKIDRGWQALLKGCIDHSLRGFDAESTKFSRRTGDKLSHANYFKNQGNITRLLSAPVGSELKRLARAALSV